MRLEMARRSTPSVVSRVFALILVVCLIECTSGSCLSYGHSCWGAHGKRSGKPASAPDWYLARVLRRMAVNSEMDRVQPNDISATLQRDAANTGTFSNHIAALDETPVDLAPLRNPEAKPMLDEELLTKMKIWQMMREATEDK